MIDRDRITERVNVSTFNLELRRAIRPLIVIAIGFVIAIACVEYILFGISGGIGSTHTMKIEVSDATGVVPGRAESRFYGIRAGFITGAQLEGGHAVLTVSIADKFGNVYKNAQAELRPNTALNDMYLDITNRGTPSAGIAGPNYTIPIDQTHSPTNLADVLNTFQPDVRDQLNNILDDAGNGLADRGADLKRAFALLAPLLSIAGNVSQQLAVRSDLTKQLVHNTSILTQTLAQRSTQLHGLVTNGTHTLEALATEGGAPLRQTIALGPSVLSLAHNTFTAFQNDTPELDQLLGDLGPVAKALPSGLANLKALARRADPAVVKLQTPVTRLVPLADALRPLAGQLSTALTRMQPQIADVNDATTDLVQCGNDINEFFNWDVSMSKFTDSIGATVRGNLNFGFYSVPGVTQTNFTQGHNCSGGTALGAVPTPKDNGPAPAP
jgi:phospholipid/cholesterol/gamma-HCH transport system substrate-binding protein